MCVERERYLCSLGENENACVIITGPLVSLIVRRMCFLAQSRNNMCSYGIYVREYEHTVVCERMQDFGVRTIHTFIRTYPLITSE